MADSGDSQVKKEKSGENEVGSLGLALALLYGAGLTTANLFLGTFGLSDLFVVRPKAIYWRVCG